MSCEERTCWQVYVRAFSDLSYATPHETSRLQGSVFVETTLFNLNELRLKGTTSIVRARHRSSCVGTCISPSLPRREPMAELTGGTRDSPSSRWAGPALLACAETPATRKESRSPKEWSDCHRVFGTSRNCKSFLLQILDASTALPRRKPRLFNVVLGSKNEDLGISQLRD